MLLYRGYYLKFYILTHTHIRKWHCGIPLNFQLVKSTSFFLLLLLFTKLWRIIKNTTQVAKYTQKLSFQNWDKKIMLLVSQNYLNDTWVRYDIRKIYLYSDKTRQDKSIDINITKKIYFGLDLWNFTKT